MKRYGVPSPMQSEEVQAKCRKTHMERYGVEYTFFIPYVIERTFSEEAKEKSVKPNERMVRSIHQSYRKIFRNI